MLQAQDAGDRNSTLVGHVRVKPCALSIVEEQFFLALCFPAWCSSWAYQQLLEGLQFWLRIHRLAKLLRVLLLQQEGNRCVLHGKDPL